MGHTLETRKLELLERDEALKAVLEAANANLALYLDRAELAELDLAPLRERVEAHLADEERYRREKTSDPVLNDPGFDRYDRARAE